MATIVGNSLAAVSDTATVTGQHGQPCLPALHSSLACGCHEQVLVAESVREIASKTTEIFEPDFGGFGSQRAPVHACVFYVFSFF